MTHAGSANPGHVTHRHRTALALLRAAGSGGNLTTDAQVAAIALRHGAVVHTSDSDFARFPKVRWHNPLR